MSTHNWRAYWDFPRTKITALSISDDGQITLVKLAPDKRYLPICSGCQQKVRSVHSYHSRGIRDLPMGESMTLLQLQYRKVRCPRCGIRVEHHEFVAPYARVTHRLARLIFELCQHMTVEEVAQHYRLSWDQVKQIDKTLLQQHHEKRPLEEVNILGIDEISVRKHHHYLTIITNYDTGEVIGVIQDRTYETLAKFLRNLKENNDIRINAVVIDMWDPYIKAIRECCPEAHIVFDLFHVVAAFGRVIDQIRNQEYRNTTTEMKTLLKGSRYLLLKNPQNLHPQERPRLKQILQQNQRLALVYILRDYLKRLWQYKYRKWAQKFLDYWCQLAQESGIAELQKFAKTLQKYSYGILNHCQYPLHTSKLEGINNKIKVIKRRAYGYHDIEYFGLKIIQATCN
ncbi:MAG: ISL3 family transposase [Gammaproteobacteria bacterium]|nr:MAG: ISL3 family transposase [Gammaproteobacteria bacterium]